MTDTMTLENPNFQSNLDLQLFKTEESLKEKFNQEKLEIIKKYLDDKKINYNKNIESIKEIKKDLEKNLDEVTFNSVSNDIDKIEDNFNELLNDLKNGSTTGFTKFINNISKITQPITSSVTNSLATRSAIVLAPTLLSKLAVGGAVASASAFKLSKAKKSGQIIDKMYQCNKTLQELELTKDEDGKIIDTRFKENIQEIIKDYFKNNNIDFYDSGYLSLREEMYSLDLDHKKELVNIINNNLGNRINFQERLDTIHETFFDKLKYDAKKVLKTTTNVVGTTAVINTINPAILSAPLSGSILGTIIGKLSESPLLGTISGLSTSALNAGAQYIPIIGEFVTKTNAGINILAAGSIGVTAGIVGCIANKIFKIIKNMGDKFSTQRDRKKINKLDQEKYKKENAAEFKKYHEYITSKENNFEEQALIDIIYGYAKDNEIKMINKPKNYNELENCIKNLSISDKDKLTKLFEKLEIYNENKNEFLISLKKIKDVVLSLTTLGLAGLSVYDIIKDGTFLPELSSKIFKDIPNNIYLQIPNKIMIDGIEKTGQLNSDEISKMIVNPDKAKQNYAALSKMQTIEIVEGNKIPIMIENKYNNFVDDFKNFWSNLWNNTKEFFNNPFDGGNYHWQKYDDISILQNENNKNIYININKNQINDYINSLSEQDLVDLAYYYNSNPTNNNIHKVIGDILNNKLSKITNLIENYNDKMKMVYATSTAEKIVGETVVAANKYQEEKNNQKTATI